MLLDKTKEVRSKNAKVFELHKKHSSSAAINADTNIKAPSMLAKLQSAIVYISAVAIISLPVHR